MYTFTHGQLCLLFPEPLSSYHGSLSLFFCFLSHAHIVKIDNFSPHRARVMYTLQMPLLLDDGYNLHSPPPPPPLSNVERVKLLRHSL